MTLKLETDIGYLVAADGQDSNGKPDCFLDMDAPARVARGRERDRLLLQMHLQSGGSESPRLVELLSLAHRHYYGTPGSVTAAARAAINAVNGLMLDGNRAGGVPPLQAGLTCAVMRGSELYVTQAGPGKAVMLRQKSVEQFPERKRLLRPLGMADKTEVNYYHTMLAEGDLLCMGRLEPIDGKLTSLRFSGNDNWQEYLTVLREMINGYAPALLCRFCASGQKGQLGASLAAGAQVAAVVKGTVGSERKPESGSALKPPAKVPEVIVDDVIDPLVIPDPDWQRAPALEGNEHANSVREQEPTAQGSSLPEAYLINGEQGFSEAAEPAAPELDNYAGVAQEPFKRAVLDSERPQLGDKFSGSGHDEFTPASLIPQSVGATVSGSESEIEGLSEDVLKPMMISAESRVDLRKRALPSTGKATMRRPRPAPTVVLLEPAVARVRQWYLRMPLTAFQHQVESGAASLQRSLSGATQKLFARVLPGNDPEVQLPGSALLWFAAGVPVLVVVLTIAAYIQFGRAREFNYYLNEARAAATFARTAPDPAQGVPHWREVLERTSQAADLRRNHPEVVALQQVAQGVLDGADRVERVRVKAITADGFRADANLVKILARGSSVYALDETNQAVYRAVLTTSGEYQMDPVFECHRGPVGMQSIEALADITWLSRPNVVGQDTLLALDPGGRLLYCTTDGAMAATVLTPPYDGWVGPVAIEAFQNRIYVLEPGANEIWVYEREDKFFADPPDRYFSESAIDLSAAIDMSIVQGTVFILHRDGHMTQCVRDEQGAVPECSIETRYSDGRLGRSDDIRFDGLAAPIAMVAYAPPHSSLYLTDSRSSGAYQFSLRLVYQREFRAVNENGEIPATSFAVGSGRDLLFANGNNVYVGKRR